MQNLNLLKARKAEMEVTEAEINHSISLWKHSRTQLLRQGIYLFVRVVDDDTVLKAKAELCQWSLANRRKPLTIILSSPGGGVSAGLGLLDVLNGLAASGHHLTIKVRGMAASMGSILLQAGIPGKRRRIISASSKVLIHPPWSWYDRPMTAVQVQYEAKEMKNMWQHLCRVLVNDSDTTLTAEELEARVDGDDWWLSPQEAVDFGFADEIG